MYMCLFISMSFGKIYRYRDRLLTRTKYIDSIWKYKIGIVRKNRREKESKEQGLVELLPYIPVYLSPVTTNFPMVTVLLFNPPLGENYLM